MYCLAPSCSIERLLFCLGQGRGGGDPRRGNATGLAPSCIHMYIYTERDTFKKGLCFGKHKMQGQCKGPSTKLYIYIYICIHREILKGSLPRHIYITRKDIYPDKTSACIDWFLVCLCTCRNESYSHVTPESNCMVGPMLWSHGRASPATHHNYKPNSTIRFTIFSVYVFGTPETIFLVY